MEFRVLGPLEVVVDGRPVRLGGARPRAVLAVLLVHANRPVSVERLIDQVWGETPPATAVAALQMHVSALRKILGTRLATTPAGYRLDVADGELDAARFAAAVRAGPAELAAVLALWRGEPYAGVPTGPDVAAARHRLVEQRLTATEAWAQAELDAGRHEQALPELARLVDEQPARTGLTRRYLLALYRSGRETEASDAYLGLADRLKREFGAEPGDELVALARAIERRDPTLAAPIALPRPASRFIGRRRELERLAAELGRCRLLTITGPGGSGKTRVAYELTADTAADHPDGVHVVELAGLRTGGAIADRLAGLLPERPAGAEPLDAVAAHLRTRRVLLVLDNCEHVIDDCARLAESLLSACPGLRVLATSREPLGVPGERVWPLTGLAVPGAGAGPDQIAGSEAVRLLADRATAARPGLRLTGTTLATAGRLCRLLSGLPLAIELAAAQLRVVPLTELTRQLHRGLDSGLALADRRSRTGPSRHRTMRAAIDWSYRLLDPPEQAVFRKLSVFAGGFGATGAEAVGGTPEMLARLVDGSMLGAEPWPDGMRYRMLELIRQYASERLAESDEAPAVRDRQAAWCAELAAASANFGGTDHTDLVRRLDREAANLRAGLAWCLGEGDDPEQALRIASPLWWYWWARGLMSEARDWLNRALAALDPTPTPLRGSALRATAALTRNGGDYVAARVLGEECLAVYRALGDTVGTISALGGLCVTAIAEREFDAAVRYGRQSAALAARAGDRLRYASALNNVGLAMRCQRRLDEATDAFTEALDNWRAVADRRGEAATLNNFAMIARLRADAPTARRLYRESLAIYRDLDLVEGMLDTVEGLAGLAVEDGYHEHGLRLFVVAERERARLGAPVFVQDELADHAAARAAAHAALGHRAVEVIRDAADDRLELNVARLLREVSEAAPEVDCRMSVSGV